MSNTWNKIANSRPPKDGRPIMIGWWEGETFHTRRAWWDKEFETTGYSERYQLSIYRGGWTDGSVEDWGMQKLAEYHPTHWRPLPKNPRKD